MLLLYNLFIELNYCSLFKCILLEIIYFYFYFILKYFIDYKITCGYGRHEKETKIK